MVPDVWNHLQKSTSARIALGRVGGSLPTRESLLFAADHADARDAVYTALDAPALQRSLGLTVSMLQSQAPDRATYLKRPDLGRKLNTESLCKLRNLDSSGSDVALIIADGLSAVAAQRHAVPLVNALKPMLMASGFSLAPICIVTQARVAIADHIGDALKARLSVILIGERPGLRTSDSLGAYITYAPTPGRTDADRNCVSNISPTNLAPEAAAKVIFWLVQQALDRRLSGVGLKDESGSSSNAVFPEKSADERTLESYCEKLD